MENRQRLPIIGRVGKEKFALDNDEAVSLDLFGEAVGLDEGFEN